MFKQSNQMSEKLEVVRLKLNMKKRHRETQNAHQHQTENGALRRENLNFTQFAIQIGDTIQIH